MSPKKGSGRTTRMLERAVQLSAEGRAMYLVFATRDDAVRAEKQLNNLAIKCETWASVDRQLDLETLRLAHAHPNCLVLIDHAAIESRFGAMLAELHRYDENRPASPTEDWQ